MVTQDRTDDALFSSLYPGLRRFAAVTAPSDLDPDDLLQEALAQTLRRQPLHALDHPAAYLRRTMVNLASNHRRSQARRRQADHRMEAVGVEQARYPSDLDDLDRLGPDERAALYLAEVERVPFREIAEALGCSEAAARARASRARRRLRDALAAETKEQQGHG